MLGEKQDDNLLPRNPNDTGNEPRTLYTNNLLLDTLYCLLRSKSKPEVVRPLLQVFISYIKL